MSLTLTSLSVQLRRQAHPPSLRSSLTLLLLVVTTFILYAAVPLLFAASDAILFLDHAVIQAVETHGLPLVERELAPVQRLILHKAYRRTSDDILDRRPSRPWLSWTFLLGVLVCTYLLSLASYLAAFLLQPPSPAVRACPARMRLSHGLLFVLAASVVLAHWVLSFCIYAPANTLLSSFDRTRYIRKCLDDLETRCEARSGWARAELCLLLEQAVTLTLSNPLEGEDLISAAFKQAVESSKFTYERYIPAGLVIAVIIAVFVQLSLMSKLRHRLIDDSIQPPPTGQDAYGTGMTAIPDDARFEELEE